MSMCRLSPSRKVNQGGVTLIGLLFWSILLCSAALVFMRVAPAVGEYRTILSMVKKVAHEGGGPWLKSVQPITGRSKSSTA